MADTKPTIRQSVRKRNMISTDFLKHYFNSLSPLTVDEWKFIDSRFKVITCKKGDFILTPNKTCTNVYFNPTGIFRLFAIDRKGNERNYLFRMEGSFVADYDSFLHQQKSRYFIECIKETQLIALDYQSALIIYDKIPAFQKIGRLVAEQLYVLAKERVEDFMFLSAEERYLKLMAQHPEVFEKIPLGYIAEYLNIRPQSLSRIRKRIVPKNVL
jgi:CRP-like cAMP-binding protein